MKILVDDIPKEGLKLELTLPSNWVRERVEDPGDDFKFVDNIGIDVELHKSKNGVKIEGTYTANADLVCPKCLDTFTLPITSRFNIRLMPETFSTRTKEIRLSYRDLDVEYFDGVVVDLEEIILSELVISFPHDKLCREDCKGLCPVCGTNWNYGTCEHIKTHSNNKESLGFYLKNTLKF